MVYQCENIKWTSDNDSVISMNGQFTGNDPERYYGYSVKSISTGTATVTAAAESGKSAQYTVVVKDYKNVFSWEKPNRRLLIRRTEDIFSTFPMKTVTILLFRG